MEGLAIHHGPNHARTAARQSRSVGSGSRRPGIEPRNRANFGIADPVPLWGRRNRIRRNRELEEKSPGSQTPSMREMSICRNWEISKASKGEWKYGSVGEGQQPEARHARLREVRHRHSTWEGLEPARRRTRVATQGETGGKGGGQGDPRSWKLEARLRACCTQSNFPRRETEGRIRPAKTASRYHPRQEPYEEIPHVRIWAGGDR